MRPRMVTEGVAVVGTRDGLLAYSTMPFPDVRIGDVVRVTLIAGAVEDMGFCDTEGCANASIAYVRCSTEGVI